MIMKFRFNIDFVSYKASDIEVYSFYKARLGDFKQLLRFNLSQSKLSGINREVLDLAESLFISSRFSSNSNFVYQVMNYAINSLQVIKDHSGEYYIGFDARLRNPFCDNLTFDHLFRIIEFGHEKIKPLKLFRHSFIQLHDKAVKLFNKQYGWRKEQFK
jgi:hypothetical protein